MKWEEKHPVLLNMSEIVGDVGNITRHPENSQRYARDVGRILFKGSKKHLRKSKVLMIRRRNQYD